MVYFNNFKNLNVNANPKVPIINSYDMFAIRPSVVKSETCSDPEKIFENVCRNSECDIISIDCGQRYSFFLDKTHIKMALLRGAIFEITYAQGMLEQPVNTRKVFINNAMNLVKLSRGGNGIIIASETNRKIFMRSPIDVFQIAGLIGMDQNKARQTLTQNCVLALSHANHRRTHRGVAKVGAIEIQDSEESGSEEEEEKKMDLD